MKKSLARLIVKLIGKKIQSRLSFYLDSRENKTLELNDNILDYEFCEKTDINNIVVKDASLKIPNTLWGAPVSVFVYENRKDSNLYREAKIKKHIYTTKGSKLSEFLFMIAGWTNFTIKVDKPIESWSKKFFEQLRKDILEANNKLNAINKNGKR